MCMTFLPISCIVVISVSWVISSLKNTCSGVTLLWKNRKHCMSIIYLRSTRSFIIVIPVKLYIPCYRNFCTFHNLDYMPYTVFRSHISGAGVCVNIKMNKFFIEVARGFEWQLQGDGRVAQRFQKGALHNSSALWSAYIVFALLR